MEACVFRSSNSNPCSGECSGTPVLKQPCRFTLFSRALRDSRLSAREEDCVEQQTEGGEGLAAVLDRESEKNNPAGAQRGLDDRRSAGDDGLALQPAADQQVLIGVADQGLNPRTGGLVRRAGREEP